MMDSGGPRTVRLEEVRYAVRQRIGRRVAESVHIDERVVLEDIVRTIEVGLLRERLPEQRIVDHTSFEVPRFRSWRDHLYATYRGRWWLGWLPKPRFVGSPQTHRVTVSVLANWTYPRADTVVPAREFGHVVLYTEPVTWRSAVTPW